MNTWSATLNDLGTWSVESRHELVAIVEKAEHAHLVAAAPDLLEALVSAREAIERLLRRGLKDNGFDPLELDDVVRAHPDLVRLEAAITGATP